MKQKDRDINSKRQIEQKHKEVQKDNETKNAQFIYRAYIFMTVAGNSSYFRLPRELIGRLKTRQLIWSLQNKEARPWKIYNLIWNPINNSPKKLLKNAMMEMAN